MTPLDAQRLRSLIENHLRYTNSAAPSRYSTTGASTCRSSSRSCRPNIAARWKKCWPTQHPPVATAAVEDVQPWVSQPVSWSSTRQERDARCPCRNASSSTKSSCRPCPTARRAAAGRAVHGLRHPVLSHRLPGQQHHSGLERSGVSGRLADALEVLHSTNNFPEFTGRICPAPCEAACTLNINNDAVTIKTIEHAIIDKAWEEGWISHCRPRTKPANRSPWSVPARRAWPARSNWRAPATSVMLFEKNDRIGGLMRYGIPDFKMEKAHHRPAHRTDARRRRGVPHQRACRRGHHRHSSC